MFFLTTPFDCQCFLNGWIPRVVEHSPHASGAKFLDTTAANSSQDRGAHVPGILVPQPDELFLTCVTSKVTSDCLVDVMEQWWQSVRERFASVKTLVINLDNGPENHSHCTQFFNRLVTFAQSINSRSIWPIILRITAHTIRLNGVGAFWRPTGMGIC